MRGAERIGFPRGSSLTAGRAVLADAARAVDPGLAAAIEAEPDWRRGYLAAFHRLTVLESAGPAAARAVAGAGLAALRRHLVVDRGGRQEPLGQALARWRAGTVAVSGEPGELRTVTVRGTGPRARPGLWLPYRGRLVGGAELLAVLDDWRARGVMEPSAAEALAEVVAHPEWLDLRDATVAVLGAGSELGPFRPLAAWGAHLLAVDLPGRERWERLSEVIRRSPGRLSVPVPGRGPAATAETEAAVAGADLAGAVPALTRWLSAAGGPLTLAGSVYAPGREHLRAAVAADALIELLGAVRPELSVAFLGTPTDAVPVPAAATAAARDRYRGAGPPRRAARGLVRAASGGRWLRPAYPDGGPGAGRETGVCDGLVGRQGPNYALAKRVERWRAELAAADGRRVSFHVAPPSRTRSVVGNRLLAAAYSGLPRFGVEVFDPGTARVLMAALLVRDLRRPAAGRLDTGVAVHGGVWRAPYLARSVVGPAVLLGGLPGRGPRR